MMDAPRPTSELAADVLEPSIGQQADWWLSGASTADPKVLVRALVARITDLEAKLAKGWDEVVANDKARAIRAEIALEAAEAQVAALTQERDIAREVRSAAEAQADADLVTALATTRQALTDIVHQYDSATNQRAQADATYQMQAIARRALAATEP